MNMARKIKQIWLLHHTTIGFCPIDPIIAAGFEWEVAHFIQSANTQSTKLLRECAYRFMDNEKCNIEMHIDTLAMMVGAGVVDAENSYVVFADGSALAANGWGQTFWHPVDNFVSNDDYACID